MEFLCTYTKNIAYFVVFTAFAEIIILEGNYRKYINIITGFFVIFLSVAPISAVFSNLNIITEKNFFAADWEFNKRLMQKEEKYYNSKKNDIILMEMKKDVEKRTADILNIYGQVKKVSVEIDKEKMDIKNVYAELVLKENKKFIRIENKNEITELEEKLKNIISDFYNLDNNNINIIVRKS